MTDVFLLINEARDAEIAYHELLRKLFREFDVPSRYSPAVRFKKHFAKAWRASPTRISVDGQTYKRIDGPYVRGAATCFVCSYVDVDLATRNCLVFVSSAEEVPT